MPNDKNPGKPGKAQRHKPERHTVYDGEKRPAKRWYEAPSIPDPGRKRIGRKATIKMESDGGDVIWRKTRSGLEWLCSGETSYVVAVVTFGP